MAISIRTRKLLWGRSGNRCAICRVELSKENDEAGHTLYGEECHIISKSADGPRHIPDLPMDYDGYDNLLLLCRNDHAAVDTEQLKFNPVYLLIIKTEHEQWISASLNSAQTIESGEKETPAQEYERTKGQTELVLLRQLKSGKQELELVRNATAYLFEYDEQLPESDLPLIHGYLQNIKDWGDVVSAMEISERTDAIIAMSREIQELESRGFLVFAATHNCKHLISKDDIWTVPVAIVSVLKKDDERIMSNPEGSERGMFAIHKTWIDRFTV